MKFISLGMNEKICKRSEATRYMSISQQNKQKIMFVKLEFIMIQNINSSKVIYLSYNTTSLNEHNKMGIILVYVNSTAIDGI
jgi:hypothetical protein